MAVNFYGISLLQMDHILGLESGRWDTDYEHLQQIAITADRLGFTVHSWVQVSMKHLLLLQV